MSLDESDVRTFVAALPETIEGAHHGHPDFRVRGKIFATLWPSQGRSVFRLPRPLALALATESPASLSVVSDREPFAWLSVQVEGVTRERFQPLLEEARRWRAPPDLVDSKLDTASE